MSDILGFIAAGLAGGGISMLLLPVIGYLGKSHLTHQLSKDIEKRKIELQKELEAEKAKHARELESYKTSIIALSEQIKASNEIKKQIALKVHEIRFKELAALHLACTAVPGDYIDFITTPIEARTEDVNKRIQERLDAISGGMMRLTLFLKEDEVDKITALNKYLRFGLNRYLHADTKNIQALTIEMRPYTGPVHEMVKNRLRAIMEMT
ncbi:hypothetical protein [Xanthomonas sp. LMG 12462]|uniref:hypothetical protein n=1 Tax=Xanthomonas sp. LMG 12462 TaxID=1591134 RepID=UPI0012649E06|nr:hypothetical protein [Xanthomonas sp. LMG 12462]